MRSKSLSVVLAVLSSLLAFDAVAQAPPKPSIETPTEGDRAITGTFTRSEAPQIDKFTAFVNNFAVLAESTSLETDTDTFHIVLTNPLPSGAQVKVLHRVFADQAAVDNGSEPVGQTESSEESVTPAVLRSGRLRAEFTFGAILSKEREEFSETDLYLDLSLDATWRVPERTSHWLFNTFFTVRLTSIPVAVDTKTETSEPADPPDEPDSLSSFIASKKGALIQLGFYMPLWRDSWVDDPDEEGKTTVFFVAPLAKIGFQSINEEIKTIRDDPDDLFEIQAFGVRIGQLRCREGIKEGIEVESYLDLTVGKWEAFEECVGKIKQPTPISCGDPPAGGTKISNFRFGLEGRLKIPGAPIILGIDLNSGEDRDDVRFILGTRFDIASLFVRLNG